MKRPHQNKQSGQAMTEFTVALAALVPILLLFPMMGKYTDIKHASIQAARYEAWEYTAWYADNGDRPQGYTKYQPVKSLRDTNREARKRFMSNTSLGLAANDREGWDAANRNPLWMSHNSLPLYTAATENGSRQSDSGKVPDVSGKTISRTLSNVDNYFKAMQQEVGLLSAAAKPAPFTAIRDKGYFVSNIQLPVNASSAYAPKAAFRSSGTAELPDTLFFSAQAAVLADGWNSGGREYSYEQSKRLSTTPLLKDASMRFLQDKVGGILPTPELSSDQLKWGYMKPDVVHPDRLSSTGKHTCGDGYLPTLWRDHGICSYVP